MADLMTTDEDVIAYLHAIGATQDGPGQWWLDGYNIADHGTDWFIYVGRDMTGGLSPTDALGRLRKHYPIPAAPVPDPTPKSTAAEEAAVDSSGWVLGEWEGGAPYGVPDFRRWASADPAIWWGAASTSGYVRARPTGAGGASIGGRMLLDKPGAARDECDAVLREHGYLPPLTESARLTATMTAMAGAAEVLARTSLREMVDALAPSEPTVGSPEGREAIADEARLRGWTRGFAGDYRRADGVIAVEWHVEDVVIIRGVNAVSITLDGPVSEAIAAIRRLYPLGTTAGYDAATDTITETTPNRPLPHPMLDGGRLVRDPSVHTPPPAAPAVTITAAEEGGYVVTGPDGVVTQGETLAEAAANLVEALRAGGEGPIYDDGTSAVMSIRVPLAGPRHGKPISVSVAAVQYQSGEVLSISPPTWTPVTPPAPPTVATDDRVATVTQGESLPDTAPAGSLHVRRDGVWVRVPNDHADRLSTQYAAAKAAVDDLIHNAEGLAAVVLPESDLDDIRATLRTSRGPAVWSAMKERVRGDRTSLREFIVAMQAETATVADLTSENALLRRDLRDCRNLVRRCRDVPSAIGFTIEDDPSTDELREVLDWHDAMRIRIAKITISAWVGDNRVHDEGDDPCAPTSKRARIRGAVSG